MAVLLLGAGLLRGTSTLWRWGAPALAAVFLAVTGVLLVADLKHPERFYLIFTRPQWKSWLVRGAFLIAVYGLVLALHLVAGAAGWSALQGGLAVPGVVAAVLTAAYTAYLFAQARARDLWESPWLAPHLALQALLAGAAALVPCAGWLDPTVIRPLVVTLAGAGLAHLAFVWVEAGGRPRVGRQETAHARLAVHELTGGRFRRVFSTGIALTVLGVVAAAAVAVTGGTSALATGALAAVLSLAGLLAYDHAYVQAGQAVPLA